MKLINNFEIVNIENDFLLVPVGSQLESFKGTVVLNETSAFLIEELKKGVTKEELLRSFIDVFDVDTRIAEKDIATAIDKLRFLGLIDD